MCVLISGQYFTNHQQQQQQRQQRQTDLQTEVAVPRDAGDGSLGSLGHRQTEAGMGQVHQHRQVVCNRQLTYHADSYRYINFTVLSDRQQDERFTGWTTSSANVKTPCRQSPLDQPQVKKFFIPSKEKVGATHKEQRQCKRLTLKKCATTRSIYRTHHSIITITILILTIYKSEIRMSASVLKQNPNTKKVKRIADLI